MKFSFFTLGCKVNQYETQAMEQLLLQRGHSLGRFDEVCDGYIINTCTVTATGDKKSRNMVRRARKLNPDAVIGVCGCYAQVSPDEVAALDVDVVSGTGDRQGFLDRMEQAAREKIRLRDVDNARQRHHVVRPVLPEIGPQAAGGPGRPGSGNLHCCSRSLSEIVRFFDRIARNGLKMGLGQIEVFMRMCC